MAVTGDESADLRDGGPPQLPVDAATLARLDGTACRSCGARDTLVPDRLEYTSDGMGGYHGWIAAACPRHTRGRS